jgi:hypothetical protein
MWQYNTFDKLFCNIFFYTLPRMLNFNLVKDHSMLAKATPTTASQDLHTQTSFSETELCAHWGICPKTAFNRRKQGRMPHHFMRGQQVRYLVLDIEAFEKLNA